MIYNISDLDGLILDNIKYSTLCIDVGLAIDAPHAAYWMSKDNNCCVIGFEPNAECAKILYEGRPPTDKFMYARLKDKKLLQKGIIEQSYEKDQFFPFNMAVDNVTSPIQLDFFHTDSRNLGCSSLLEPTQHLNLDVTEVNKVDVVSLEYVLEHMGADKFDKIDFVKTDAQGKDFDVVKSLGKYLPKVVGLKCEYNVKNFYENPNNSQQFTDFVRENGFKILAKDGYDFWAFNTRYLHLFPTDDDIKTFLIGHSPVGLG